MAKLTIVADLAADETDNVNSSMNDLSYNSCHLRSQPTAGTTTAEAGTGQRHEAMKQTM